MKREPVAVTTPFIKLDAFLKFCGAAETGGHAKLLVMEGEVKVGGEICTQRGKKLYPGTVVTLGDREFEVVAGED